MVATALRDLDALIEKARDDEAEGPMVDYLYHLAFIRDRIEAKCPNLVPWVVAYGPFLRALDSGDTKSRRDVHLLAVTNLKDYFKAVTLLSEKVLGPAYMKFGHFLDFDVWVLEDLKAASTKKSLAWNRVTRGITVYGSLDSALERA